MLYNFINKARNHLRRFRNRKSNEEQHGHAAEVEDAVIVTAAEEASVIRQEPGDPARPRSRRGRRRKRGPLSGISTARTSPRWSEKDGEKIPETIHEWDPTRFQVAPEEGRTRFHDLNLPDQILHAVADLGFQYCTPVQAAMLSHAIMGEDATSRAQTGTGKSAAFLIAILVRLLGSTLKQKRPKGSPRALILAPTRELVGQIEQDGLALSKYTSIKIIPVFGGMAFDHQRKQLTQGPVDILVATPGRLLDFVKRGTIRLDQVETLVIDEADRMLDMGFIPDVRRIIGHTPPKERRQTLFFSATLTQDVIRLSDQWTKNPLRVDIMPEQMTVDTVDQKVYMITAKEKFTLLFNLITQQNLTRVMVFCNRRDETQRLQKKLSHYGISCTLLTGDVPQQQRIKRLEDFRAGKIQVLVGTDLVGRGIHIEGISHVVNFNLPYEPENYVHRIGRTARAGASGTSISFADEEESFYLPEIEEYIGCKLGCVFPPEELLKAPPLPKKGALFSKKTKHDNEG